MKTKKVFVLFVAIFFVATSFSIVLNAFTEDTLKGSIIKVSGSAYITDKETGEWVKAIEGTSLFMGDTIKTDKKSSIVLELNGDNLVKLGPKTEIKISVFIREVYKKDDKTINKYTTRLKLAWGLIYTIAKDLSGASIFEIETVNSIAGVRGTEFSLERKDDVDKLVVLKGIVSFKNFKVGDEIEVGANMASTVKGKSPASEPEKASDKDLKALENAVTNMTSSFDDSHKKSDGDDDSSGDDGDDDEAGGDDSGDDDNDSGDDDNDSGDDDNDSGDDDNDSGDDDNDSGDDDNDSGDDDDDDDDD